MEINQHLESENIKIIVEKTKLNYFLVHVMNKNIKGRDD